MTVLAGKTLPVIKTFTRIKTFTERKKSKFFPTFLKLKTFNMMIQRQANHHRKQ